MGSRCTLLRPGLVDYQDAWQLQQRLARAVADGAAPTLILLQHPPTYTLGARGNTANLLQNEAVLRARGAEVVRSDRGGDVTFHGPGQLVVYPIIDLRRFGQGPVWYVRTLEAVVIEALACFGVAASCMPGRHGVWIGDAKIAAVGVRISRGITMHGFALNVSTDLTWFQTIIPCGIADAGVTSLERLTGEAFDVAEVESQVAAAFSRRFDFDFDFDDSAPALEGALVAG